MNKAKPYFSIFCGYFYLWLLLGTIIYLPVLLFGDQLNFYQPEPRNCIPSVSYFITSLHCNIPLTDIVFLLFVTIPSIIIALASMATGFVINLSEESIPWLTLSIPSIIFCIIGASYWQQKNHWIKWLLPLLIIPLLIYNGSRW